MLSDVVEAAKVMDSLPEINFVMSLILPVDVDQRIYDRYQMEVILNHTTKPIVFVAPFCFSKVSVDIRLSFDKIPPSSLTRCVGCA